MGWTKSLTANKPILETDIKTVIQKLPEELKGIFKGSEQDWGWSCAADVWKPKDNSFSISGSYGMSGAIKEVFTDTFIKLMEELGYTLFVERSD